jgi:N-acylneuraminate cytidylyltransferase/CMP-N,N'-diacetyllegionaminic acid synthase
MNALITICARKDSKRLPGKNILPFCNRPLISWTVYQAEVFKKRMFLKGNHKTPNIDIILCTDIDDQKLKCLDLPIFDRPNYELNNDDAQKIKVIRYAADRAEDYFKRKYEIVIDLDVTSPCRLVNDIITAFNIGVVEKPPTLFSVVKSRKKPNFNQITFSKDGITKLLDEVTPVYDLNASIYIYNREWLKKGINDPICRNSCLLFMQPWQAFDIDTRDDFDIVEFLFQKHILDKGRI